MMLRVPLIVLTDCGKQLVTPMATREYRGERRGKSAFFSCSTKGEWAKLNTEKNLDDGASMVGYSELLDRSMISGVRQGQGDPRTGQSHPH